MLTKTDDHIDSVTFIVEGITAAAPADYETDLINSLSTLSGITLSGVAKPLRDQEIRLPLKITPDTPISEAEMRLLDIKIACAMLGIEAEFPLLSGEVMEGAAGKGLLSEAWQHLPAGAPVITRTTNFRTVHLVLPKLKFENNSLVVDRKITKFMASNPCWGWDLPVQDDSDTRFIFDLVNMLLSTSQIGQIFTPFVALFASQSAAGISWNNVLKTARCAAEQISKENDVALLKGSLSALNNMLNTTYLPHKNKIKGSTGEARIRYMQDAYAWGSSIVTSMTSTLGALSANNLGAPALIAYVAGAGTIIGLYQDLSTVDAAVSDPKDSVAIISMCNFAKQAALHVENTVNSLLNERSESIHVIEETQERSRCSGGLAPTCVPIGTRVSGYYWKDQIKGTSSGSWKVTYESEIDGKRNACRADMDKYKNPILRKLEDQLAPLLKAASAFTGATIPIAIP